MKLNLIETDPFSDSKDDKKYFNRIHLMIAIVVFCYLPIFYFTGFKFSFWFLFLISIIMNPIVYYLHKYNYCNLARLLIIIACNFGVFFTSLGAGHAIGSQQYCFSYMVLALLLFNRRSVKIVIFGNFLAILTAWLIFKKSFLFWHAPIFSKAMPFEIFHQINFFGSAFLLGIFVYLFLEDSKTQQARIARLMGTSNLNFVKLKACENELKQIKHAISQNLMISITNASGEIKFVNELFCSSTGFSSKELIGENFLNFLSEKNSKSFFKQIWETLHKEAFWKGIIENKSKEGNFIKYKAIIYSIRNLDNVLTEYIAIYIPIKDFSNTNK